MSIVGLRAFPSPVDCDEAHLRALANLRTTDLSDAMRKAGTMTGILSFTVPAQPMIGFAVTVSAPVGGFDLVKLGLELCRPGDVLVVSARGETTNALWGGNLSLGAQRRGVAGLVVDGAVRDVEEVSDLKFPVFARATAVSASQLEAPFGEVNVPIACGGVVVTPGDIVIGDRDGVVVVRPADVAEVAASTQKVLDGHRAIHAQLEAGLVTSREAILARLAAGGMTIPETVAR